jgi:dolichol-phosphate mannosyltransferase
MKKIVIVIPCYNEEESLPHTLKALETVQESISKEYQLDILFVNDGSSDKTQEQLVLASKMNRSIYYREFAHNAGHQSALRAGINASVHHDAAIMMDADLQHPPELIPEMIAAWEKGAKIVQMVRDDSAEDVGAIRYAVRRSYYRGLNWLSNLKLEYGASDFRLIDRAVALTVAESPERGLFLRGYFSWLPVSRTVITYKPNKRVAGTSKYTLRKLLDLAYQSVLQFSEKPLRIAVSIGLCFSVLSMLYGVYLIIMHLTGVYTVSGWTSLMVIMLFCFGLNFMLLGIIGSYMSHSISIQKQRPEFVIASERIPAK